MDNKFKTSFSFESYIKIGFVSGLVCHASGLATTTIVEKDCPTNSKL